MAAEMKLNYCRAKYYCNGLSNKMLIHGLRSSPSIHLIVNLSELKLLQTFRKFLFTDPFSLFVILHA